ncbi:ribonuclease H-like domain-containing protein, partial [Tanacetum coccineum]
NKSKSDKGYHAVPPPYTGNFIPFKPDLTFMDEIVKSENMDVTTIVTPSNVKVELNHESAGVKSNGDADEPKTVRKNSFRPPIIKDWNSDDESEVEIIPKNKTVSSSTEKIKFVKSGKINTASASVNTAVRPVNTAGSKPTMNHPRPISNAYKNGYSQVTRPFNKYSKYKNNIFNKKVNTVRVKDTTARDRAVVSENKGKGVNAVKASACWVWKAKNSSKEYKEKGVIDSGCSRHINGNKCYLTEYEDYDGGFVSFGDGKGRISRKGKIKTGTLDFDNVCFCKELKYNLFSVSQICDKKNNVLFTDTECLVLSSDFKLLDESQVLLRVPRKDNIYSVDLKSVVPTKEVYPQRFLKIIILVLLVRKESNTKPPDETSGILKTFITEIENQLDYKVKVIKSDNGTEFKNSVMDQFCKIKGIKREFSVARTLQQNGIAERKNRTLIKATRTMLVNSKLPTTFWAVAVNTACYVLNKVLVIKPNSKTPYEFIRGRTPLMEKLMRDFLLDWLFDVDSLSKSMNYVLVVTGNQTNGPKDSEEDVGVKHTEVDVSEVSDKDGKDEQDSRSEFERLLQQEKHTKHPNSIKSINIVSTPVSTVEPSSTNDAPSSLVNAAKTSEEHLFEQFSPLKNAFTLPDVPNGSPMDDNTRIFAGAYDDDDVSRQADLNNLETTMNVSSIPTTRINKDHPDTDHPKDQIIEDFNSTIQTRRMTKISDEHAMVSYINKQRRTNHKDYQKCLFSCFLSQKEPKKVIQALVDPSWVEAMQEELLQFKLQKKFDLPREDNKHSNRTNKALVKDAEAESSFVYLYISMIGSFMYLTASRPDIIYLKGQPKLGLWYPRDSPFNLEAFSDSDYAEASLDRKSTKELSNFLE